MTVYRKGNDLIIKLPNNIDAKILQRLLDYINYNELTEKGEARQEEVDRLAKEVNTGWWAKNKGRFLND